MRDSRFDEAVGGDFNYNQTTWLNQAHFSLGEQWQLGVRLDADMANGLPVNHKDTRIISF